MQHFYSLDVDIAFMIDQGIIVSLLLFSLFPRGVAGSNLLWVYSFF